MSNSNREIEIEIIIEAARKLGSLPSGMTPSQARADLAELDRRRIKRLRWQAEEALRKKQVTAA